MKRAKQREPRRPSYAATWEFCRALRRAAASGDAMATSLECLAEATLDVVEAVERGNRSGRAQAEASAAILLAKVRSTP